MGEIFNVNRTHWMQTEEKEKLKIGKRRRISEGNLWTVELFDVSSKFFYRLIIPFINL